MGLTRRQWLGLAATAGLGWGGLHLAFRRQFASDQTPEGAYLRIAQAMAKDDPKQLFAYLEDEAQWASYTIRDVRRRARDRIAASYPEPQRAELLAQHEAVAAAPDGSDAFVALLVQRGWSKRLRKDLSGVERVEASGDRASVVTVRGTRWPFRRRKNGIWGLTVFSAELLAESEKATRDLDVVTAAADDYDRARAPERHAAPALPSP
jgi:hypothetical protein